jgi:hypothetical protein
MGQFDASREMIRALWSKRAKREPPNRGCSTDAVIFEIMVEIDRPMRSLGR